MLKAEKRHTKACRASEYDRNVKKCKCPYRAVGMLNGVFIRKALKTSSQEQAQKILREWEASGAAEQTAEQIRIDNAQHPSCAISKRATGRNRLSENSERCWLIGCNSTRVR